MSDPRNVVPLSRHATASDDRLDSWKEIAAYLGREVRTVQGWEKTESLPIHRHLHSRQGSVYAFKSELDAWRRARNAVSETPSAILAVPEHRARPWRLIWVAKVAGLMVLAVLGAYLWRNRPDWSSGSAPSTVAVLPFLDFSPQKDQEYFADGLTEEIIDALSRVPGFRVVARTSAFAFKGKPNDIREIGRQLNANVVLEGSVRKDGDQLRITAQLNRVSDGTHLWSRTFDRQLRDIFGVQREISQAIAGQLRAGPVPQHEPTRNLEAYDLFQEGRYFFNQGLANSLAKAQERFERAIQVDPQFALAYTGLADTQAYLAEHMMAAPKEVMPQARISAEKAIALDPNLAEAHTSLGIVKLDYDWDRDAAQREFLKAIELNPGSGYARHWYAHSLEAQGRLDQALHEMRAALELDPLSVMIHWDIANELLMSHRYDDALRQLDKSLELFPRHPLLLYFQAYARHAKNDRQGAHQSLESFRAATAETPDLPFFRTVYGIEAAWDGRRAEAEATLRDLEQARATQYVDAVIVTFLCDSLGDRNGLHRWFERARDEHATLFVYTPVMRGVYFSAGDPEVDAIIAKLQ